ncbi:MAG: thioredoxin family protein [Bacteroidota bacterium]|nr:thioredoxin family protein [Bacteroidota bacterium]
MKLFLSFLMVLFVAAGVNAQTHAVSTEKIYNETADAKADIAHSIELAKHPHKNILLDFGGNWCIWCHRLDSLFHTNKQIAGLLEKKFIVVHVDIGKFDKNLDIAEKYGANLKKMGVPALVVLDDEGEVLKVENTGELESGKGHSPVKVLKFLRAYSPV